MSEKQVLAVDYGASSGRVMLGGFDGASFTISELHRFPNDPVKLGDTMYWDVLRLFFEMKQGIVKSKAYGAISGIGVDTWGVDFGLLDREGRLLDNPVHYRDGRTAGMMEKTLKMVGRDPLYELTGNQLMEINTLFQLMAVKERRPELLERADALLLMPDLFQYFLSGAKISEKSIASTTQMMDMRKGKWAFGLLKTLGLRAGIMRDILPGAVRTGSLRPEIRKELGVPAVEVIAVAGHDTQSAMAAIPAREEDFLFISCGTWGLFGTELTEPVISEMSKKFNITNEAGLEGKYAFLKNIIGLWLIQESRRQWIREGKEYGFGELEAKAACTEPLKSLINPDAPEFVPAGDIPERIRQFCQKTGQPVPQSEGETVCCIDQSLALAYRKAMDEIRACTGKQYAVIHLIGGGAQSGLLCQMTANACGLPVVAGPVEATVYGNAMAQFMALGELNGLAQARRVLADTLHTVVYEPRDREIWEEAYERYREIL
ncbi:rhamnulokinase/L-fuculokinase [Hungatella effluvii]|uniref:Rhamnulokinase/L-fuculokinase n=1 Tax=Hungatella effluvii TaxID=1096246 RepID=A0A2V3YAJ5_9FIRM|nr:rhamnulokinase family protein [Hungatella effluvii]PXX48162.1 rhamnulokinase/L-fuculokinase [Hungatella effluvii]